MQSTRSCFLHALILLEKTDLGAHMSKIADDFDGKQDPGRDMYRCSDNLDFWKRPVWKPTWPDNRIFLLEKDCPGSLHGFGMVCFW